MLQLQLLFKGKKILICYTDYLSAKCDVNSSIFMATKLIIIIIFVVVVIICTITITLLFTSRD